MRIHSRWGLLGGGSLGALSLLLAATPAAAQEPGRQPDEATEVGEIVVTAQKREERLTDVPISISVIGSEALEAGQVNGVTDVLRGVPGVGSYENGQAGMTKFAIRGVTSNNSLFNGSSTVGYYLDEIPFAFVRFPVSPDASAYDIERVEVLRGPQGTLYGANSLNGVIRVMTADADLHRREIKARGTVSATEDGGANHRWDAAIGIPLIEGKLAVRAVAGYSDYSGWLEQPATGRSDVNDTRQTNLRLKINAAPTERLQVELLGWTSRTERGDSSVAPASGALLSTIPQPIDTRFDALGATVTYDFGWANLVSSTNKITFESQSIIDNPLGVDRLLTAISADLFSQEVRLVSSGEGPWRWSLGAIYRDEEDTQFSDYTRNALPAFLGVSDNVYTSESFAAYGEVTRVLLDGRVELTGGLRYFTDEASSNERQALSTGVTPFGARSDKFEAWTPRAVVRFKPDEATSLYASYSQGFRSGFAQNGEVLRLSNGLAPSIQPDRLHNYELGAKGTALDRRLSYDAAVYYIRWDSTVQVVSTTIGNPADPANSTTFFGAVNAPGASGWGLDLGGDLRLTSAMRLGATFSWNDLTFDRDVLSGGVPILREGMRLLESPEYTASAYWNYRFPLFGDFDGELTASVSYTSPMWTGTVNNNTRAESDEILQARASFGLLSGRGWSATLFVDNLTDERGFVRKTVGNPPTGDHLRPRTIGFQLDLEY